MQITPKKRCFIYLIVFFCLAATMVGVAQNKTISLVPIQATVCQLESHPELYDGTLVQVRGRVYFGKFDFVIDADCEPHRQGRVWLDFGGDIVSPSEYWGIGNFLLKQPGVNVRVQGISIPAVRDGAMERFVDEVGATRFRKPNGDPCGPECQFYEVSATLTGMFFSGLRHGFGMEECCHLLVIERVTGLSSKRTSVPLGGEYECESDRWQPSAEELKELSAVPACSLVESFQGCYPILAKHWGDSIARDAGLNNDRPWISPDMTRYYKFSGGFVSRAVGKDAAGNPLYASEMTLSSFVTREVCHEILPPKPASDRVSCRFYRSGVLDTKENAMTSQKRVAAGEVWRSSDMAKVGWMAAEDAQRGWQLASASELKLEKCVPWPPSNDTGDDQQQWGYCTWLTKDDLEEITVRLHKPGYLKGPGGNIENVGWVASDVAINLCSVRPN